MTLQVNTENLEEIISGKDITLLQFSAEWCGPCKMLAPIMLKLSEENDKINIGKVNVDTESEIGVNFGVRKIPTIIYFKGGKEIERTTGLKTQEEIQNKINSLLN